LANLHAGGVRVAQDFETAFDLFNRAAATGDAEAIAEVGHAYERGEGTERDFEAALKHYRIAAEYGNMWSMNHLADLLIRFDADGKRQPESVAEALSWIHRSIESGSLRGLFLLGFCHLEGIV